MSIVPIPESDLIRFWSKVDKSGPIPEHCPELGACWPWIAACHTNGYGAFFLNHRHRLAHVISYEWHIGPVGGLKVLHHCDRKPCVKPTHLYAGTMLQNARDAVERGLYCIGERNGRAKLTGTGLREIRRLYAAGISQAELSRRFGVRKQTINGIIHGRGWKHVT